MMIMQKREVETSKTVEQMVNELVNKGYSEIEAIKIIHDKYEIENKLDFISIIIHISSLILILSLFNSSSFIISLKIALGIFYSIFFVGYAALRIFYPKELKQLSSLHTLGISLATSFAIIAMIGLLLNFTIGITVYTGIIGIVILTETFNIIYNLRGYR
ncbi:hypothetical protein [Saccharolobus islandicus]|uniref:DUF1616 domain-containing protein n=1 Tax=Saccharolobus islandicus (strain M.14.25 / Kamchatka \|nr:hypothetical protein [Sulfolobus islandicus]ACP37457.1 hypothetical protein M1425_0631 [Sulfolobus islandicus M.14.25]